MDVDVDRAAAAVLEKHRAAGTYFRAAGVGSFVLQEGDGEPVVLMHGLPASSFLYRKVIPELAARGFRALSFDWPGLGLAERPTEFDYTLVGISALGGGRASTRSGLIAFISSCTMPAAPWGLSSHCGCVSGYVR